MNPKFSTELYALTDMIILTLLFAILTLGSVDAHISTKNKQFVDEDGRTHIFRGQNAVYKIAPWLPKAHGWDSETTLSDVDARNLKKWGFNVIRLGVMWPGLEPGKRGDYSKKYLHDVQVIVETLASHGVSVVLDLHQDLFARDFCGEGVPDYVVDTCKQYMPEGMNAFPAPVWHNSSAETFDENGDPALDWCLQVPFFEYYLSEEVSAMFQCLYDNRDTLWDAMGGFWRAVADHFKDSPSVLGYELINEPWLGDVYNKKDLLLPQQTEKQFLEPMYQHIHEYIREVDDHKIIFFEGVTIDYWQSGFSQVPGGVDYGDRSALAYHIYCPLQDVTPGKLLACKGIDKEFMHFRQKDAERLGSGLIMTEFGAMQDIHGDMQEMEKLCQMADEVNASWMYWQFKYYQDLTTMTPIGESMYSAEGGHLSYEKLRVLSRTYPQVTAGTLGKFMFNSRNAHFDMSYVPFVDRKDLTTFVYMNKELHYPHGAKIDIDNNSVEMKCSDLGVEFVYGGTDEVTVNINITPCGKDDNCTCN